MDKRTLLAFLVIFLIIVGWSALMKQLYPEPPGGAAADSLGVTEFAAGRESGPDAGEGVSAPAPGAADASLRFQEVPQTVDPADQGAAGADASGGDLRSAADALRPVNQSGSVEMAVVRTPLYTAEISSRGARITSWELNDYELDNGNLVDLVPEDAPGTWGADMLIFTAEPLPLGTVLYAVEGPAQISLGADDAPRAVVFALRTAGGLVIRKIYTFDPATYGIRAEMSVGSDDAQRATDALVLTGRPERAIFGWNQGIAATERQLRTTAQAFRSFARVGEDLHFKRRNDLRKGPEKVEAVFTGTALFAGVQNKYFTVCGIVPPVADGVTEGRIELGGDQERMQQSWAMQLPLRRAPERGALAVAAIEMYLGPQLEANLQAYGVGLEGTMEMGWKLVRPLARAVLWIMEQMARVISNYGVIIIVFSVLTKLAFYPLTRKSTQSMKRMQEVQPKIKAIQEKYKDDREKQSQATMALYKEEKINPASGCLPLVIQMPVFVALYQALMHTIALRQKPFILWIDDLSQPDALFALPFSLPFLGSDFNLLPILMSASMWVQTKMTPTPAAGGQMAVMNSILPVMMLVFFYQMPAGLVIYWLVNTVMTIYQTWRIHKTASPKGSVNPV